MFIYTLITVLIVLVSIALIFVVMIQNSKGGGLAAGFSANNNIMGVRKTTDVVEKATWWLVGIVVALCIASTAFYTRGGAKESNQLQRAVEDRAAASPVVGAPAFDGGQVTPSLEGAATPAEGTPAATSTQEAPAETPVAPASETPAAPAN